MSHNATIFPRQRMLKIAVLLAGLIIPQAILYGPSLVGQRILLPLDILKAGACYLPPEELMIARTAGGTVRPMNPYRPLNNSLADQVLSYEIERQFVAAEFRAGRLPLWTPYQFSGAPFVNWPKYSPFSLMYCLVPSPKSLAWIQLIKSVIGGVGAFLFFRRGLFLGFWPSTIAAWCFPLTAHFALWQGYPQTYVTIWYPWMLLITDRLVRQPKSWAGPALAVMTALVLISGQLDTAGHVLLASGVFALYCLVREHRSHPVSKETGIAVGVLIGGWGSGFLLAAPELLPVMEYSVTGLRLSDVREIVSDRPPGGISSIPRIVLPKINGAVERGWYHLGGLREFESASATYTGLLATLVIAPLAWCSRRHRSVSVVLVILALLGLGWVLNIPGVIHILQLPGLNLRPHNRLVFVASFSILSFAAIGLDVLWHNQWKRSLWFVIPPVLLLITGGYCVYRANVLPEPIATELLRNFQQGIRTRDIPDVDAVTEIQTSYRQFMISSAGVCLVGLVATIALWWRKDRQRQMVILLAPLLCAELIWYGYGMNPQCDPELYYPKIPILEKLATLPAGRVLGVGGLPPKVNEVYGLYEVRGYDGVDPGRYVELLLHFDDPRFASPPYAKIQSYVPKMDLSPSGDLLLPPILDMLGVRYVIFAPHVLPFMPQVTPMPALQDLTDELGYLVVESKRGLPRVFIPRTVLPSEDPELTFARVTRPSFSPRELAYVEQPIDVLRDCRGTGTIVSETPNDVVVSVEMETKGLMVLADRWDRGWRAYSGGRELPILRTNYVLRGVELPPGKSTVVFRYEPPSFLWGVRLMLLATGVLIGWAILCVRATAGNNDGEALLPRP